MTDAELAEIEAREKAATPGPWKHDLDIFDPDEPEFVACFFDEPLNMLGQIPTHIISDSANPAASEAARAHQANKDAAFIVAARSDVPALVAEIRRLRKELAMADRFVRRTMT